jgi:RimJ/RimL family protein N-acetyltransferase
MDVEIATPRLRLRPQQLGDVDAFIAGLNDWEVVRWLTVVPYPYTVTDLDEWLARRKLPAPGRAHFAIELPGEGMIGVVSLEGDLGYWLSRQHHRHGYMTEACVALLEWHFAVFPDDVVLSGYHIGNAASAAVQRNLGFVETGESDMRFVRSQQREIEHIHTSLTRAQFEVSPARQGRM